MLFCKFRNNSHQFSGMGNQFLPWWVQLHGWYKILRPALVFCEAGHSLWACERVARTRYLEYLKVRTVCMKEIRKILLMPNPLSNLFSSQCSYFPSSDVSLLLLLPLPSLPQHISEALLSASPRLYWAHRNRPNTAASRSPGAHGQMEAVDISQIITRTGRSYKLQWVQWRHRAHAGRLASVLTVLDFSLEEERFCPCVCFWRKGAPTGLFKALPFLGGLILSAQRPPSMLGGMNALMTGQSGDLSIFQGRTRTDWWGGFISSIFR